MARKEKVRFDHRRVRLKVGESERANGTYFYRWTDRFGKRHAVYAPTLDQLRAKEEQITVDQHDGIKAGTNNITINHMFDLWRDLKRGLKDNTLSSYIYMYDTFVRPTFGRSKLTKVKKSDVRAFYNTLAEDRGLKYTTIDGLHNVLHQVFQVAVDDDLIRKNPTDHVMRELLLANGNDSEKRNALTKWQQETFLMFLYETPKYRHWYPVFYVMLNTGMRVGEITGLRWCDIDMKKGFISINHTLVYYDHRDEKGYYYSINTPKTKAGIREIPMTSGVKAALLMERTYQSEVGIKSISHIDGYKDFVFLNRYGEVHQLGALNKVIKRVIRDCNFELLDRCEGEEDPQLLPDFSCHILRHTFATRAVEAGLNIKTVQSIMGHADISTTLGIYVDCTAEMKSEEISAFENYMKTGTKKDAAK